MSGQEINWSILALSRFVLACVVLATHLQWVDQGGISSFLSMFDGKAAVVGFLVISGFSVTWSLDRNSAGFVGRRFVRIYPAYAVSLICAVILGAALGNFELAGKSFQLDGWYTIACNAVLLQMYACKAVSTIPVIWSLSLEFSYYVLIYVFRRRGTALLALAAAGSIIHFMLPDGLIAGRAYDLLMKLNMVRYLWPFLLGVLLARTSDKRIWLASAIGGTVLLGFSPSMHEALSAATFALTMAALALAKWGWGKRSATLEFLGDVSYPLYLVHLPVLLVCVAFAGVENTVVITLASLAAAVFVLLAVERPFAALRRSMGSWREAKDKAQAGLPGAPVPRTGSETNLA